MDKICEFCAEVKPMVYCHADAAYLCLSCDSKVHSANEVSNRHPRSLLCDSCRYLPASTRCTDHRMFVCKTCDESFHATVRHRRRPITSYVGCPSAHAFAALWGFDLSNKRQSDSSFELNQILDLKDLQAGSERDASAVVRERAGVNTGGFSLADQLSPQNEFRVDDEEKIMRFSEAETSPFGCTLGETFWGCQSPSHDSSCESWSKSLQDVDNCGYLVCNEDFDIPDVDTSFSNFEDLFKGD